MLPYEELLAAATVAQAGGFARAAAELHITQSAVSQRIRKLEDSLGQLVLSRTNPPRLTALGRRLVQHLHEVRRLEEEIEPLNGSSQHASPRNVVLTIGVNADSLATWVLDALDKFARTERVRLEFIVEDEDYTLELLRKGEVVGCVTTARDTIQGGDVEFLGALKYVCVCTPRFKREHFGRHKCNVAEELLAAPCISFSRKDDLNERFLERVFGTKSPSLCAHFVGSNQSYNEALLKGWGWGLAPKCQVESFVRRKRLINLIPAEPELVKLYWHQWRRRTALEARLADAVSQGAQRWLSGETP